MSDTSLVLLVDVAALPGGLIAALEKEGCQVETLPIEQVSGALLISAPQAIVTTRVHAAEVARAVRSSATQLDLPFLVLAPQADVARYRSQMPREVTALVPATTDVTALAARVKTTIWQAKSKRVRPRTLVGVAGLSGLTVPRPAAVPSPPAPPTPPPFANDAFDDPDEVTNVLTPEALEPPKAVSTASPLEPEPLEPEPLEPDEDEPVPVDPEPLDASFLEDATDDNGESTNVTNFVPAKVAPAGAPVIAPPPPPTAAPSLPSPARPSASARPSPVAPNTANRGAIHQWIDVKSTSSRPPPPIPAEAPVEVGLPASEVLKLRIALVDDDVTRADAIGKALRLEGQEVLLTTAGSTAPRWALLRQFAPQVIVMDSESPHDGGLREAIGEDPFLRETPLVFHSFSSIFQDATGKANVVALDQKLAGIGKAELEFTLGLEAGQPMDVARAQINPGRLLALLKEFGRSVVVRVEQGEEVLTWVLAGGLAGTAALQGSGAPTSLTPVQALDHLLKRQHSKISVQARRDVSVGRGEDVYELLERAYREYLPRTPVRPSSPTGSSPVASGPNAALLMDAGSDSSFPPAERPSRPPRHLIPTSAFLELREDSKLLGGSKGVSLGAVIVILLVVFALGAGAAVGINRLSQTGAKTAQAEIRGTPIEVSNQPVSNQPGPSPNTEKEGDSAQGSSDRVDPEEADPKAAQETAKDKPEGRWAIAEPVQVTTCEDLLGKTADAYAGKPKWRSANAWKLARKALMAGRREDAQKAMCEAAFIDPGGQASSGLAGLYLSQRALEQGEAWARRGIEAKPDNRRAKELLGDALNQMGKVDEAKTIWLETLKLTEADTTKLATVARTLSGSAQTAIKGGDTPLAERLLRRGATFDPENADIAASLAHVLLKNDERGLAEMWANWAQSLDPECAEALFVLGELALLDGEKDEARELFGKVPKQSKLASLAKERLAGL